MNETCNCRHHSYVTSKDSIVNTVTGANHLHSRRLSIELGKNTITIMLTNICISDHNIVAH